MAKLKHPTPSMSIYIQTALHRNTTGFAGAHYVIGKDRPLGLFALTIAVLQIVFTDYAYLGDSAETLSEEIDQIRAWLTKARFVDDAEPIETAENCLFKPI